MLIFAFPLRAIPSPRAEPGLLQVPPVQLMVLEDLQPFPNFHLCLTLPIPNNTMEHGPRLPQGIITWVLVFKGFLQHSWLHFCVWLQCVCSGRGASSVLVQRLCRQACSPALPKQCLSPISMSAKEENKRGVYWLPLKPAVEVWGCQGQCSRA